MRIGSQIRRISLLLVLIGGDAARAVEPGDAALTWRNLANVPAKTEVAGAFAGVSHDALILAGGANFPNQTLAEGGAAAKVWHDRIIVLPGLDGAWQVAAEKLPRPISDGVSVTVAGGVVCLGGKDAARHYADAFQLAWRDGRVQRTELPPLPQPLAQACGAALGSTVYVACGSHVPFGATWNDAAAATNRVWKLDLTDAVPKWEEIAPLPGPGRVQAVAAVCRGKFFVLSGVELRRGEADKVVRSYLTDAYEFDPARGWRRLADLPRSASAAPSPAPTLGDAQVLLISGVTADRTAPQNHVGFVDEILAYDAATNAWSRRGTTPLPRIVTPCVPWRGGFVIPCGELHPGIRSPTVTWTKTR